MNDGEWELLSIPSRYWQIHQDNTDYAHIQFNVRELLSQLCIFVTFTTEGMMRKVESEKVELQMLLQII